MTTKTVAGGIVTDAASDTQRVNYCLAVHYGTVKRITDCDHHITISANTYEARPGALQTPQLVNRDGRNEVVIRVHNQKDSATEFGQLDIAEDTAGRQVELWRVCWPSGTQSELKIFDGYALNMKGGEAWCEIRAIQETGFRSRPANREVWHKCGYDLADDNCGFDGAATVCNYTLASCRSKVGAAAQTGTGLDDMSADGTFTASDLYYYYVEIDATGSPDTFKWGKRALVDTYPPASWTATGVSITGSEQTLDEGIKVTFTAVTGHTLGDYWTVKASNEDRLGAFLHVPPPGTVLELGGTGQVLQGPGGVGTVFNWDSPIIDLGDQTYGEDTTTGVVPVVNPPPRRPGRP